MSNLDRLYIAVIFFLISLNVELLKPNGVTEQEPIICSTAEHTERQMLLSYDVVGNDVIDLDHGGVYYVLNCAGLKNEK